MTLSPLLLQRNNPEIHFNHINEKICAEFKACMIFPQRVTISAGVVVELKEISSIVLEIMLLNPDVLCCAQLHQPFEGRSPVHAPPDPGPH